MKTIAIFCYSFLPMMGGEQVEFSMMLNELDKHLSKKKEFNVHFIAPNNICKPYCKFKNIKTHYLSLNFEKEKNVKSATLMRNVLMLRKIVKKIQPDLIHVLSITPGAAMVYALRYLGVKKPYVVTSQGADLTVLPEIKYGNRLNPLYNWLSKIIMKKAVVHQVPSTAMKKFCHQIGVSDKKILVIPNSIPNEDPKKPSLASVAKFKKKYGLTKNDVVFLSLSGIRAVKGMKYMVDGFIEAAKTNPRVKILLASKQNKLSDEITNKLKKHKLEKNIIFIGLITGEEKEAAFASAYGFCMPSLFESFGIALIEAMQRGKICIATNVGGMQDIIDDNKNGYFVKVKSAKAITEKVLEIAKNVDNQGQIIAAAKKKANTYKMNIVLKEFIKMFKKLTE